MQLLITSLPTLAVSLLYCAWNTYRIRLRERTLRARVAYMLWVMATEID